MIEIIRVDENGIQMTSDIEDVGNAAVIWEQAYAELARLA